MFYVYEILNLVNGKRYIGKTNDPKNRWNKHLNVAENTQSNRRNLVHKAIYKYGKDNFKFSIMGECNSEEEAFVKEIELIAHFKTNVMRYGEKYGYNLTDGGGGKSGWIVSEETRNKHRGKTHSLESIEKMRKAKLGKKLTPEHVEKLANINRGRVHTEQARLNMKAGMKRGADRTNSKLTDEQVLDIKKLILNRIPDTVIGRAFGVTRELVRDIRKGKIWSHILLQNDVDITHLLPILKYKRITKCLQESEVLNIKQLLADGNSIEVIAAKFKMSKATIRDIKNGRTWREVKI